MIFNGLFDLSLSGFILLTLVLTHITIVSVTVYLHRHQAHRALDLHPLLSHFFRFWLWLTTGMVTREWVAIHRKHHAKCETESDPHSPQTRGLGKVLWQGAELYQEEAGNPETLERYGKGTPDDWLERKLYQRHNYSGILLLLLLEIILLGPAGITLWAIQMIWIPFWAAGVINGIGHYWGYRNFEIPNASTNIVPWGIFIGGEELHNNHHAFASSAKLSNRWWEFDLGWFYIRLFSILGLAQVLKVAPRRAFVDERPQLDMDAIKALTVNRLQLFSDYRRKVMKPVFRDEIRQAKRPIRRLYRSAQRLVRLDSMLLSDSDLAQLKEILDTNAALNKVYEFKLKLQAIWEQQTSSHEKRLEALSQWCAQAEESGVEALREFVSILRSYGMRPLR
ncbi:MAG: fatty acid desaturase [Candidatus Thiodiazotropha sp. (ex Lucina pensylvanica)]|nr:fatty acid desaturase [Candidatus Thiodiazotropha taylori]MBT3058476.1 fatty acid desaturase [Candidatus Thiodiazotropha sp. (ex Lucina pensylvanica)]MBV2094918.1 fatty acid desaturase [Candidatus Thiodiazotropha sp. (ex Codakia orbicularis)]